MKKYNPKEIEPKWQKAWEDNEIYKVDFSDHSKPKYYAFSMLPGITGSGLHTGHGRTYQFSDVKTRAKRQQGYNAYHPIGWDSFGLPVENYALKVGKKPRDAHDEAKVNFKNQLKRLGYSYDWSKEISTADPEYYKWTQWIFLKLYENGLAYQKESAQWWCNKCNTVLANEQVVSGKCWRHDGADDEPVVRKNLKQWFFKITEYADEILEATDDLDWTESVKLMQKNWIGKSKGMIFSSPVKDTSLTIETFSAHFEAFCADTFVVIAPDHPKLKELVAGLDNEEEILESAARMVGERALRGYADEEDSEGIFTGRYTEDPVGNGELPIWVASYALADYGTGIVKCSAHDERDFKFAKKYGIKLKPVLFPIDEAEAEKVRNLEVCFTDMANGILTEPEIFKGKVAGGQRNEIIEYLEHKKLATSKTSYKMRDWLISRQRYWGAPIPIIHCVDHGAVAVPEEDLPVILPDVEDYKPTRGNTSILADQKEWVNAPCPTCGKMGKRETDTQDGYACSSWYFLRYLDPFNEKQAWDPEIVKHWGPVDFYNGADHAVAHLLYARFWQRFFYKLGLVGSPEPFRRMMYNAYIMAPDGRKMSKSLGNVIDPLEVMDSGYGADALRVYEMFIAPYDMEAPWDTRGVPGTYRFLNRVWNLAQEYLESEPVKLSDEAEKEILTLSYKTSKKVTEDIEHEKFNTAVAAMMEAVNGLFKLKEKFGIGKNDTWKEAIESLLQVLAPFAPHITEELWHDLGHTETIHIDTWPKWGEKYLVSDTITIAVQVNGKLRAEIEVDSDASKEEVLSLVKENEKIATWLDGNEIKKEIYVPGKIVNLVV
jgi:leucyl-tRNA synthetase